MLRGAEGSISGPSFNNLSMQLRHCCNHPFLIKGVVQAENPDPNPDPNPNPNPSPNPNPNQGARGMRRPEARASWRWPPAWVRQGMGPTSYSDT